MSSGKLIELTLSPSPVFACPGVIGISSLKKACLLVPECEGSAPGTF